VLLDNGINSLPISANGAFTFATAIPLDGSFAVTVGTRALGQNCTITNGSGNPVTANVTNVTVTCANRPEFAYVATFAGGAVGQLSIGSNGALTPLSPATVPLGDTVFSITVDPTGSFAYVACQSSLAQYAIGPDGALTSIAAPITSSREWFAVHPSGRFAYGNAGNAIAQYTIGPDGVLVPMSPATVPLGASSGQPLAIDPSGRFLYVAEFASNAVAQFSIGADGALTPMNPASMPAGSGNDSIAVDPNGRFVYVVNQFDDTVSRYAIGSDGALTPLTPDLSTGLNPVSIAIDPSGSFAYVVTSNDGKISQYAIGADGTLTMVGSPVSENTPVSIAIDPSGRFAYVGDFEDSVTLFTIGAGGALTNGPSVLAGPTQQAGGNAFTITTTR
jgi:6-phosphogluconolactonase (cycloisomerase 2 family)